MFNAKGLIPATALKFLLIAGLGALSACATTSSPAPVSNQIGSAGANNAGQNPSGSNTQANGQAYSDGFGAIIVANPNPTPSAVKIPKAPPSSAEAPSSL